MDNVCWGGGSWPAVCDGTQNVKRYRYRYFFPVPNIFDTDTGTFSGTKIFQYRFWDFFPILNFTDNGSETFSGTIFFPKNGSVTTKKREKNSLYRYVTFWREVDQLERGGHLDIVWKVISIFWPKTLQILFLSPTVPFKSLFKPFEIWLG